MNSGGRSYNALLLYHPRQNRSHGYSQNTACHFPANHGQDPIRCNGGAKAQILLHCLSLPSILPFPHSWLFYLNLSSIQVIIKSSIQISSVAICAGHDPWNQVALPLFC